MSSKKLLTAGGKSPQLWEANITTGVTSAGKGGTVCGYNTLTGQTIIGTISDNTVDYLGNAVFLRLWQAINTSGFRTLTVVLSGVLPEDSFDEIQLVDIIVPRLGSTYTTDGVNSFWSWRAFPTLIPVTANVAYAFKMRAL